ncbi:hypothetical protein SEPCBS57363_002760 [Sporothrix epigloea]|uniref:SET domain-containing protein n=1 Tax=Sporothrix epigloea TaxID=1892477 RepID=A0ABP0DHW4_9PEZI
MAHVQESIDLLPRWQRLNSIELINSRVAAIPGKGFGLVALNDGLQASRLTAEDVSDNSGHDSRSPLIFVPADLVLHAEAVKEYAKQDRNFHLLLDAAGHRGTRGNILLFLIVQLVVSSRQPGEDRAALPTPWTDYVRFLPADVPLPTMWTDAELHLLQGTSLESAVRAKLLALEREFGQLRERSSAIPFWDAALWNRKSPLQLQDWILVDAWYRSRCLELPQLGASMVPCIDMANHSCTPNAYYEDRTAVPAGRADAGVVLLLRPGQHVAALDEITISYTGSKADGMSVDGGVKPASEMLFSYGFIDPDSVRHSLVLSVQPFPDDPLGEAKRHIFGGPAPCLEIEHLDVDGGKDSDSDSDSGELNSQLPARIRWTCPFAYLMCVNEEDGLNFRLRQQTDGSKQLRMFWQDNDVTDSAREFEALTGTHELAPLFRLRVVTVLQEMIEAQLECMQAAGGDQMKDDSDDGDEDEVMEAEYEGGQPSHGPQDNKSDSENDGNDENDTDMADGNISLGVVRNSVAEQAAILRDIESKILSSALETLEAERSDLLLNSTVLAYLVSMEIPQNDLVDE